MLTPLQRIQHLLSGVETGQVLLADTTMEPVFSQVPRDIPVCWRRFSWQAAPWGRCARRLGATSRPKPATCKPLAQALEIALQKLGLGDPTRLPAALDPMFTFDVTLVAAITVSAPDEQDAREKITGALATSRAILGNWPDGAPILSTVHTDDGDGTSGLATWSRGGEAAGRSCHPGAGPCLTSLATPGATFSARNKAGAWAGRSIPLCPSAPPPQKKIGPCWRSTAAAWTLWKLLACTARLIAFGGIRKRESHGYGKRQ
jgi:hypothetical protein